jgi:hypothetical protein
MGAVYILSIGRFELLSGKEIVPPDVFMLFREDDKVLSEGEFGVTCKYSCTVQEMAERLDVLGFTESASREDFNTGVQFLIDDKEAYLEYLYDLPGARNDEGYRKIIESAKSELSTLQELTFDRWILGFRNLQKRHLLHTYQSKEEKPGNIESYMLKSEFGILGHPGDLRNCIRAVLLTSPRKQKLILDVTELVQGGIHSAEDRLSDQARSALTNNASPAEKIIVITEGGTDSKLLDESLKRIYPHLHELYAFVDFETFSLPGGTGNLVNLLKGLASCGVSNRIIAVFDNDVSGCRSQQLAFGLQLPSNFKLLRLPDIHVARRYPTLGPTGLILTDVNGAAASLELYLGKKSLSERNGLIPIQWTGFDKQLGRYQGEIIDKSTTRDRCLKLLRTSTRPKTDPNLADVRKVLKCILQAFQ